MRIKITLLFAVLCLNVQAQDCPKYTKAMEAGNKYLLTTTPNYHKARIEFQTAQIAARECGMDARSAAEGLKKVYAGLKKQKDDAIIDRDRALHAIRAKDSSDVARYKALKYAQDEKEKADSALAKAQKLIDAFYFYDGKFALAIKDDIYWKKKYGFINKEGDAVIEYKYEKAEQFEENGFAKVKKMDENGEMIDFLIDTTGKEYRVAYKSADLNGDIIALDIRGQQLTDFPEEILKNIQLQILLIGNNSIKSLPPEIGQLKTLRILDLRWDSLMVLPQEIGDLKVLQSLDLSRNHLTALPPEIGQLKALQTLNLSFNLLNILPPKIGQLKALQSLDLHYIQLEFLPPEIGQLSALQTLNLSANHLKELPPEIGQLKVLQSLDLTDNQLTVLPPEIGQLKALTELFLSGNLFSAEELLKIQLLLPNCVIVAE